MAKPNDFHADDAWQRGVRDKHLKPFYEKIGKNYIMLDPQNGEDTATMYIQRELGIDTILELDSGRVMGVEEKIVRWPESGKPHTAYALETYSCTVSGIEKDGWMWYSAADVLLWAFEQDEDWLVVDVIPFQPLKQWFFESVGRDRGAQPDGSYKIAVQRYRFYDYPMFQMPTKNKSEVRVVDVSHVFDAVEGCRRYLVNEGNITKAPDGYMPERQKA